MIPDHVGNGEFSLASGIPTDAARAFRLRRILRSGFEYVLELPMDICVFGFYEGTYEHRVWSFAWRRAEFFRDPSKSIRILGGPFFVSHEAYV